MSNKMAQLHAIIASAEAMQCHARALSDLTREIGQTSDPTQQAALEAQRLEASLAFMDAHARYAKARDEAMVVSGV